ncbi:MAG: YdeI/OmpD-associated family protein [Flavobacteriaceae bacterium]|nr:YdeI/OmpD-associated family protein [Flavobacteriaceae bacterium]
MKSPVFETALVGMHSLMIPKEMADLFVNQNHKRVKVEASFNGNKVHFHAALRTDKNGQYRITFNQNLQNELGVFPTDLFQLQFFEDDSKYGVEMPEELQAVLESDPEASDIFEACTAGKKRSIIYAILRYKNSQTRIDKSLTLAENLKRGMSDMKLLLKPI